MNFCIPWAYNSTIQCCSRVEANVQQVFSKGKRRFPSSLGMFCEAYRTILYSIHESVVLLMLLALKELLLEWNHIFPPSQLYFGKLSKLE